MEDIRYYHELNGRRYWALRDEPRHATLASYRECVRLAYGSLRGVTIGRGRPS